MELMAIILFIALVLTCAMFGLREMMLGFPSAIFWAIGGGQAYTESAAIWDIYYFIFFASLGMAIYSMYAAYGVRKSDLDTTGPHGIDPDASYHDEDKVAIDEMGEADIHTRPSRATRNVRARADKRRTLGVHGKRDHGEFE
jgi:hypothetical protein